MNNPERDAGASDNDRKFVVESISPEFLAGIKVESYIMSTDWIETNDNDETKLVRKIYDDGTEKLLHITKVGDEQSRESKKATLSKAKYDEYLEKLDQSHTHLEKRRSEFELTQNGIRFTAKYDEFADGLRVLEIDAVSKNEDERNAFDPDAFDFAVVEVTGIKRFYGHQIVSIIHPPESNEQ